MQSVSHRTIFLESFFWFRNSYLNFVSDYETYLPTGLTEHSSGHRQEQLPAITNQTNLFTSALWSKIQNFCFQAVSSGERWLSIRPNALFSSPSDRLSLSDVPSSPIHTTKQSCKSSWNSKKRNGHMPHPKIKASQQMLRGLSSFVCRYKLYGGRCRHSIWPGN